jgi:hypothetical protein
MKRQNQWDVPRKKGYVCVDGNYIPVDEVTFLDVKEDISGRDMMTFEYAGTIMKSFIVIR